MPCVQGRVWSVSSCEENYVRISTTAIVYSSLVWRRWVGVEAVLCMPRVTKATRIEVSERNRGQIGLIEVMDWAPANPRPENSDRHKNI